MAQEEIFLDETFPVVKYNNTAPLAGLALLKRRENAQVANVRVIVTDKRIVVDEKMTVLANVAAVSVGDDEKEVAEHNAVATEQAGSHPRAAVVVAAVGLAACWWTWENPPFALLVLSFCILVAWFLQKSWNPRLLTPDYAVVIESAGTRDNALVSKDRMVVQRIVRAISDALVAR